MTLCSREVKPSKGKGTPIKRTSQIGNHYHGSSAVDARILRDYRRPYYVHHGVSQPPEHLY
ncbi:hypothetical protein Sjap_025328 [Stephania japonica]|uniref:Uncharacterized protein n=1 Tax=Stephania japonica TaxID=461633 RepID=A0AAP0E5X9_9MAGN